MLQQPPAVIELADQEHFCDRQGTFAVIGGAILFGSQQDIALHRTGNAGEKAAVAAQKAQADVSLGAGTHEGGTDAAIAEGDNGLQIVQRHAPEHIVVIAHDNGFPVERQIRLRRSNVERVLQSFHVASSNARRTYSAAEPCPLSPGRHSSAMEQLLQARVILACGVYPRASSACISSSALRTRCRSSGVRGI